MTNSTRDTRRPAAWHTAIALWGLTALSSLAPDTMCAQSFSSDPTGIVDRSIFEWGDMPGNDPNPPHTASTDADRSIFGWEDMPGNGPDLPPIDTGILDDTPAPSVDVDGEYATEDLPPGGNARDEEVQGTEDNPAEGEWVTPWEWAQQAKPLDEEDGGWEWATPTPAAPPEVPVAA